MSSCTGPLVYNKASKTMKNKHIWNIEVKYILRQHDIIYKNCKKWKEKLLKLINIFSEIKGYYQQLESEIKKIILFIRALKIIKFLATKYKTFLLKLPNITKRI